MSLWTSPLAPRNAQAPQESPVNSAQFVVPEAARVVPPIQASGSAGPANAPTGAVAQRLRSRPPGYPIPGAHPRGPFPSSKLRWKRNLRWAHPWTEAFPDAPPDPKNEEKTRGPADLQGADAPGLRRQGPSTSSIPTHQGGLARRNRGNGKQIKFQEMQVCKWAFCVAKKCYVLCAMCYVRVLTYSPLSPPVEARRLLQVDMPDARRGAASAASAPFSPRCRPRGCAAARQPPLSLSLWAGPAPLGRGHGQGGDCSFQCSTSRTLEPRTSRLPSPMLLLSCLCLHLVLPLAATTGSSRERTIRWGGLLEVHVRVRMCVRQKELNIEH